MCIIIILAWIGAIALWCGVGFGSVALINWWENNEGDFHDYAIMGTLFAPFIFCYAFVHLFVHLFSVPKLYEDIKELKRGKGRR